MTTRKGIGQGLATIVAALALGLICFAANALASEPTDRSFGQDGVVLVPQSPTEALAAPAVRDLAGAPGDRMAAALAGFSHYLIPGFSSFGYFAAARFNEDGSADDSFGSGGVTANYEVPPLTKSNLPTKQKTQAQAVAVQADGKVVVVGYLEFQDSNYSIGYGPVLVRYGADGSLNPSFGEDGAVAPRSPDELAPGDLLHAVAIAPSGRIITVGVRGESSSGSERRNLVTAYTPAGRVDRRFGTRGHVVFPRQGKPSDAAVGLTAVKALRSGGILLAGYLSGRLFLARLTPSGAFDPSFGGGDGKVEIVAHPVVRCCGESAALAVQRDGKILLEGWSPEEGMTLARLLPDGRVDRAFGRDGFVVAGTRRLPNPRDLAVQGNGRIVVVGGGSRSTTGKSAALGFAALRYLPSGRLDRSFGLQRLSGGNPSAAFSALTQSNGRVVAAGSLELSSGGQGEAGLLLTRYLAGQAPVQPGRPLAEEMVDQLAGRVVHAPIVGDAILAGHRVPG